MSFDIQTWDGKPISKPGLYADLPISVYHSDCCESPSVSSSGLRTIFYYSAKHYWAQSYMNPSRKDEDPSKALVFGRAAHHLLLGEKNFGKHFAIRPTEIGGKPWQGNRTECKQWMADMREEGLTVVTNADLDQIIGMAQSLGEDPLVQSGILNGLIEHSFVWEDMETGIWLKWRPDAVPNDSMDFSDLKTTTSVQSRALERAIGTYGYHVQGALGAMACREVLGREMNSFSLVFVEKEEPWCVRTKTIRESDIALGEQQIRAALRLMATCLKTGAWPGPGGTQSDTEYSGLDEWAGRMAQARIDEIEREIA